MDCSTVISTRRSVRTYRPDPIPEVVLQEIIEAALAAPSADNLQPWFFVVVKSQKAMQRLIEIMSTAPQRLEAHLGSRFTRYPQVIAETKQFISKLGNAPICVLAFQKEKAYSNKAAIIQQSIAAAIENMLLAAWSLGVGSCWMTAPLEAGLSHNIKEEFAPEKGELAAMITLGYPEKIPLAPKRKPGRYIFL
ncbi:nitroreductase family protein [uncultured Intestinimonas sp.]|uniref:nitroreductase family protein n=1 Tax=uncultured Intestinimonas sp. TaxID=1689265 RepID=UPI0025D60325|nr:nitroreductase family protein [uncultured Intestinimonas sp.]